MTPLQFAQEECANWQNGGTCLQIIIHDDGSIGRDPKMPLQCKLGTKGTRCAYFEQCVIPMIPWIEIPKIKVEYADAVHQYRKAASLHCAAERPCPTCGRPLEPRQRFCDLCSQKRRLASKRASYWQKGG